MTWHFHGLQDLRCQFGKSRLQLERMRNSNLLESRLVQDASTMKTSEFVDAVDAQYK